MKLCDLFSTETRKMLTSNLGEVNEAMKASQQETAEQGVGQLIRAFNTSYHRYRSALAEFRNIHSLDLASLVDDLAQCTSDFQDEFTELLDVSVDGPWNPFLERQLDVALARHSAQIAELVARHDPCLRPPKAAEKMAIWNGLRRLLNGTAE